MKIYLKDGYNGDLTSKQAGSIRWRNGQEDDHEAGRTDEIRTLCRKTKQHIGFLTGHTLFFIIGNKKTLGKYIGIPILNLF